MYDQSFMLGGWENIKPDGDNTFSIEGGLSTFKNFVS